MDLPPAQGAALGAATAFTLSGFFGWLIAEYDTTPSHRAVTIIYLLQFATFAAAGVLLLQLVPKPSPEDEEASEKDPERPTVELPARPSAPAAGIV